MNILNNKKISLIGIIFLGLFFTINTIPVSFGQECGITKNLVGESDTAFKARCEAISGCQITGSFCVAKITPPEVNVSGGGTVKSTDVEQCLTVLARSATKDEACKAGEEKFECKGDPNGWKCVPKAPPADITLYSTLQAIYETGTGFVSGLLSKSGRSEYKVIVDIPCDKAIVNIIGGASCAETKGYTDSLPLYITRLYQFGFGIVGVVALLMIIIGAAKYTLSAGSFTSKDEAREQITEAIYGILLLFGAYLILYTINPELVSIKAPTLTPVNVEKFLITPAT
ncbi:MAG: pilin, partial [Patescibacteria group bacterium]